MTRNTLREIQQEEAQAIVTMYQTSKAEEVAKAFNVTVDLVWRLAKEAGFKKAKHSQAGFNPLENRLQKMTGRRFILAGLGWTVEVKGYELSDSEVRVLTDKVKPRVYKRKGALTKLEEDFLRMER